MEESECMVCFSKYDDNEYRPRFMPCGHTMCSKCLEKAIIEDSKMCPKCRTHYSAANLKELPVNFSLESLVKSLNISNCTKADILPGSAKHQLPVNQRPSEADKLPECVEHQLPVSSRCSTHKSWICHSCLDEEHSPESCNIITISEELNIKKSRKFDQSQILLNVFEETCKKSDVCKKQCKKIIAENDEEILRYEAMVKRLQEIIQKKKNSKKQMNKNYAMFVQKLESIKGKRSSYDQAILSLKSSESIRGVSSCSVEVQNEAKNLQIISKEIENEVEQIVEVFKATVESNFEFFWGNHKLSLRNGKSHLHAPPRNITPKSLFHNFEFTDKDTPPVTDGIQTFLDFGIPGQEPQRIYMKMQGNTARAKQHLLLVTGQCGHSYKGLKFYCPRRLGQPGEGLIIRPYDGKRAEPLLKNITITDGSSQKKLAGVMHGAGWDNKYDNALFGIYLNDDNEKITQTGFGIVTSGLEILQRMAKSGKIENLTVVDCGIVLFW